MCVVAPATAQEREDARRGQIEHAPGVWAPVTWDRVPAPEDVKRLYDRIGYWSATFECVIEPTYALGQCVVATRDPPGIPAEVLRSSHERSAALRVLLPAYRAPARLTDGSPTAGRRIRVRPFADPDGLPPPRPPQFPPIQATKKSDRQP